MLPLILASSSAYRRELLTKLGLPFFCEIPDIDETPAPNEEAEQLVARLSTQKVEAVGQNHPAALIIGSDQVAILSGKILGKPHTYERAFEQLKTLSGNTVEFKTGLCLFNSQSGKKQLAVEHFFVDFQELSDDQIHHYLTTEQPFDCAGSFKSEGLGIALFKRLRGDDPNSLIGLPLIRLIDMLRQEAIDPLLLAQKH